MSLNEVSNLFTRVSALEQDGNDTDQTISRVIKLYTTLGVKVKITTRLHQYRICGDTQPIYGSTCGTDTYL